MRPESTSRKPVQSPARIAAGASFRAAIRALAVVLVLAAGGCHKKTAPPPEPGKPMGRPPDLRGTRVMVLPVQSAMGFAGDADAELAFGLQARGESVSWIFPPQLQEALDRSPGLDTRIRGLAVGAFDVAEVERVGDPLYGDLLRLSALVNSEVALLPVRAWVYPGVEGPRVRLSAALIQIRTGRVYWFAVEEGQVRDPADPGALASAVETLARSLLWYLPTPGVGTTGD